MRLPSPIPLSRPHSTLNTPSAFRVEVQPPSLRHAPSSWRQRLLFWLLAPAPQDAAPPLDRLPHIKRDFVACLEDVPPEQAQTLRCAIDDARSLRELWHLRADLYACIGRVYDEREAERRIARLNTHFSTRVPRTGLSPAGAADGGPGPVRGAGRRPLTPAPALH
jgi:hypothetical protein